MNVSTNRAHPSNRAICDCIYSFCAARHDLRQLIADVAPTLAADDVQYMKLSGTFPHTMSVLSVHANGSWSNRPLFTDEMPLSAARSGDMYFYRYVCGCAQIICFNILTFYHFPYLLLFSDKNEPLKDLTVDERRTITRRENATSSSGYGSISNYSSPRRERGLKIYLDPSPKKSSSFDLIN